MFSTRRTIARGAAVAALVVIVLGIAVVGLQAGPSDPVVEVQLLVDGEQGNSFLLVTGTLPPEVQLPATLSLPAPDGAELWWAGELTGSGAESDISREVTVVAGEGGSVVEFTLETTRTGQYDALYLPTDTSGGDRTALLDWIQSSPASRLVFSVVFPAGAQDVSIDPDPASGPATNAVGDTLYVLPQVTNPEPGSRHVVQASYSTQGARGGGGSGGSGGTIFVLAVIAVVLAVILVLVVRSQSSSRVIEDEPLD